MITPGTSGDCQRKGDLVRVRWFKHRNTLARALAEQYALGWIDHEVPQVSREKAKEHYDYVMLGNGRYMNHFRKLAEELLKTL